MQSLAKFLLLSLALASASTYASGLIRGDFGYVSESKTTGGAETTTSRQTIEVAGGFMWPSGMALFGQYMMGTDTSTSGGSTTTDHRASYGPGIGYYSRAPMGFYVAGTYYFSSKLETPSVTYEGKGYQVDLGIKASFGNVAAVAGLAYDSFEYNKTSTGPLSPSDKITFIGPRIGVQMEF